VAIEAAESFKRTLAKRGLIQDEKYKDLLPETRSCICGERIGFAEKVCNKCKRLVDRGAIKRQAEADDIALKIFEKIAEKNKELIVKAIEELGFREKINNP
jgi:hypothetical protein